MIPKIIHYCWFGKNQKSDFILKCIDSWRKNLPDYQIIEWNESNCNINNSCEFVKQAYANKKWAYVSDYFRLVALKEYGGIYLDTDVEILKSFDDLLENSFFCCFESEGFLCTAVIGSEKNNKLISNFLEIYKDLEFGEIPNSKLLYDFLLHNKKCVTNSRCELDEKGVIYPSDYFSPKDFYTKKIKLTENSYAIHHFDGTWKSGGKKFKDGIQNILIKLLGKERYFSLKKKFKKQ